MTKPPPIVLHWAYSQKDPAKAELNFWFGCIGPQEVVRIYCLEHDDYIISARRPNGIHAGLSLFHVPYTKALEEAERLIRDLWE